MALNATVEPILIKERRAVITKVSRTALSGIFQRGVTFKAKSTDNDNNQRQDGTYISN